MTKYQRHSASLWEIVETLVVYCAVFSSIGLLIWWFVFGPAPKLDFRSAQELMEKRVVHDHRITIYCAAPFNRDKTIPDDSGFSGAMTWEHAVPVSEFGQNFSEWRDGHPECVRNGRPYKGRKCAEWVNSTFEQMEGDMYNLFPAIDRVNLIRSNRAYAELPGKTKSEICGYKLARGRFEPPDHAKGQVARAALYMDSRYEKFTLKSWQKDLFEFWNAEYPVSEWECTRTKRIEKIMKVENVFVKQPCQEQGLW